jgi:hypothetical protein
MEHAHLARHAVQRSESQVSRDTGDPLVAPEHRVACGRVAQYTVEMCRTSNTDTPNILTGKVFRVIVA